MLKRETLKILISVQTKKPGPNHKFHSLSLPPKRKEKHTHA